ncbi:MAG TPA: hypothetical protein VKA53_10715 [Thermoanaerobaculia bacterium]|nr:hypothetical protein [Thermoanaerobaculia bacterium]
MTLLDVIGLEAEVVTITRRAPDTRSLGLLSPGATSTFDAVVSVQPLSLRSAQMLAEGIRQRARFVLYGGDELIATDPSTGQRGDTFVRGGRTYEIVAIEDWSAQGGYFRSVAAKQEM